MTVRRTVFRTCTLCEAMCGLRLELDGNRIVSARGDENDPFSRGYICPKDVAIGDVEVVVGQSILNGIPAQLKPAVSAMAGE
jgi:hypothetical protein